ncbi:MAG: flgH, partial [Verrucomicrobiales bacterium]|nr:flgH [Verrucomicrobiales bacterium]
SKAAFIALVASQCEGQSLWKETSVAITSDKKAQKVGDILTILVQENATATKDNSTQTAKSSGADMGISSFLYGPGASGLLTKGGQYPALKFSGKTDFTGGGKINNSEAITARIAVRVMDVLPNGTLIIEGSRHTSFSGESQDAVLRGSVRIEDITANNTVFSYNVADASIKYISKGTVSNVQKKGWFTRALDKINPF